MGSTSCEDQHRAEGGDTILITNTIIPVLLMTNNAIKTPRKRERKKRNKKKKKRKQKEQIGTPTDDDDSTKNKNKI